MSTTIRIVKTPDVLHGKPRIKGTRIGVFTIGESVREGGQPVDDVLEAYPDLTRERITAALDYWTLSTDFIVGFPTETEADHELSMNLLRETRPEKVNVTRFSKRPKTDAAKMKGLGGTIKKERSKAMSELKREIVGNVYEGMVGDTREVLCVELGTGDSVKCRDSAYRQVIVQNAAEYGIEPGDFFDAEITANQTMYAFGEPV